MVDIPSNAKILFLKVDAVEVKNNEDEDVTRWGSRGKKKKINKRDVNYYNIGVVASPDELIPQPTPSLLFRVLTSGAHLELSYDKKTLEKISRNLRLENIRIVKIWE